MERVKGTDGYQQVISAYVEATKKISFDILHMEFLNFLPDYRAQILDLGAGFGRDTYELSLRGHKVIAVEPLAEFREKGNEIYASQNLKWEDDHLPYLKRLTPCNNQCDFILCSGIWHHLNEDEQLFAMARISELLRVNGHLALSLRNGLAGAGTQVFPVNLQKTISNANIFGLEVVMKQDYLPSLMANKPLVKWSKLVLHKVE